MNGPSFLNTGAIQAILMFVVALALIVVGLKLIFKADKGDVRGAANTGGVTLIAGMIIAMGLGAGWLAIANGALDSLFG